MATMKKYHIGIDARFLRSKSGGFGRYTQELLHHLAQIDRHNRYTVFITPEDKSEWTIKNTNFHPVVVNAKHYSVAEQTTFLKLLNSYKLDLVHFLNFNHPVRYKRPFVTTLHDMTLYFFPAGRSKKSKLRHLIFRLVFRHALKGANKVIAISKYSAADAIKHLGLDITKITMIYEGGPAKPEYSLQQNKLVNQYLNTNQPYFVFVSGWRPHKGILTLLKAFTEFKKSTNYAHKLVLIGEQSAAGPDVYAAIEDHSFKSDLIMPGFAPENLLPSLYHNAVACVIPSEYEGFGLPVLEAFSYKVPVIVANNSSLPEVAGPAALYFPTKNAGKLADRMREIVKDTELAPSLVQKGLLQLKKFSWQNTAKETLAVYMNVLNRTDR